MPLVKHDFEGTAPGEPHLALLTDESGLFTAIPPGATILFIRDPAKMDSIFPVVLAKVKFRGAGMGPESLTFICACGDPTCTRNYVFKCQTSGWHKRKQRPTAQQAPLESQTAQTAPSPKKAGP